MMSPRTGKASTIAANRASASRTNLRVDVDQLEAEPGGRGVDEEAIERACCAVQADGQAELIA
jgi:hypothetical protein